MKKALLKNTFREIKNTKARFISILMIVALGVGFFVGVKSTSPSMEQMAIDYYKDTNLMDFRLVSTVGFDESDVSAIEKTDGIKDVMPSYFLDVSVNYQNVGHIFRLLSVPSAYNKNNDSISDIHIVEGRLPQKSGEIAVEKTELGAYSLGDKITIEPSVGEIDVKGQLKTLEYTVVGIVKSPMYISLDRGTTNVGNGKVDGFAYIGADDFDIERYTVVYATMNKSNDLSPFTDEYDELVETFAKELELTADTQVEVFVEENIVKAQQEIDDGKKDLEQAKLDAQAEFDKAQTDIDNGKKEYNEKIASAQAEIDSAQAQIDDGQAQLDEQYAQYEASVELFNTEIIKAKEELKKGEQEYQDGCAQLETLKGTITELESQIVLVATGTIDAIIASLDPATQGTLIGALTAYSQNITASNAVDTLNTIKTFASMYAPGVLDSALDTAIATINTIEENLNPLYDIVAQTEAELANAELELENARMEIEQKEQATLEQFAIYKAELDSAQAKLDSSKLELESARAELDKAKVDGLIEIENGEQELKEAKEEAQIEFDDAQKELDDAQKELDDAPDAEWYVFDRDDNPGYANFLQDTNRVDAVATVFPLFFLLVAMLVCLTSMTRLVEEKRTEIGTLKALGYSDFSITMKFVWYSGLASIIGCIFGCTVGILTLPKVIYNAYSMLYNMRDINIVVSMGSLYLAVISAIVSCAFVTFVVCYKTLRHKPATLMRPKTPKAGKRILLERITILWNRFNFSSKVTWRNLFRYKSRLFMTALGIAGCTALMLTAFGLYDSINDVVDLQFNKISNYNTIIITDKQGEDEFRELQNTVNNDSRFSKSAAVMQKNVSVSSTSAKKDSDIYLAVAQNTDEFESMLNLRNRQSQERLSLDDSSVILTEKLANLLEVEVGDTVTIGEGDDTATVSGIAENYVSNYVYISEKAYENMTGEKAVYNTIYASAGNMSEDVEKQLGTDYLKRDDVAAISFTSSISDDFKDMVSSMNMIVLVMIICAGALAIVVLYNLTNINLAERNREIATIKVLGFTHKETSAFVYRENIILTLFGIAIGLFLGVWLWDFVVKTVEVDAIMFGKQIHVLSYFLAAALTAVFSMVVNFIMYFRIKAINMVESLKSIE